MKALIVSDLHWEYTFHHGVDESGAFDWLLKTVLTQAPEELVILGDAGHAWTPDFYQRLANITHITSIAGNHDNVSVLQSVKNNDGHRIWAKDGEIRTIGGLKFGFINGIIALAGKRKIKDGVPRISPEEYLRAARMLTGVDVLATHAGPNLPEYGGRYHNSVEFDVMDEVVGIVKPRLWVHGHLSGPYTIGRLGDSIIIKVDSSPAEKHYAIMAHKGTQIEIWHDTEMIDQVDVPL